MTSTGLREAELSTLEEWNSVYTSATTFFFKSFLFSVLLVICLSPGAV